MKNFFNNNTIKSLLHVPEHIEFTTNDPVIFYFLKADIMRSTTHLFPRLLSNLKVLLYQGYAFYIDSSDVDNLIFVMVSLPKRNGFRIYRGQECPRSNKRLGNRGIMIMVLYLAMSHKAPI